MPTITKTQFENYIRRNRKAFLRLTVEQERELAKMYLETAKSIKLKILDASGAEIWQQQQILNAVLSDAARLSKNFEDTIYQNLIQAADLGVEVDKTILADITHRLAGKGLEFDAERVLFGVPSLAVEDAYNRVWRDGLKLSDRIWALDRHTRNELESIVGQFMISGAPASDPETIARLEWLLNPDRVGITTKLHGRSVSFDAARLLRAERSIAYQEAQVYSAMRNPAAIGIAWILSSRHPRDDICDDYARHDEGLGRGVYRPENLPVRPHPQ